MYYFIVNPNAHGGRGEKIWRKLERQIIRSGIRYEAYQTEEPGDARRIAAALTADMQEPATIVAVGGDGTVNEVLNGLAISERLTFGYIPTGYGNDLARGLKLSGKPGKCLKRILNPAEICRVDYGILSYEDEEPVYSRFMVSSGIGFDAAVCHRLLDKNGRGGLRQIPGRGRYVLAGLKQLVTAKASRGYLIQDVVRHIWCWMARRRWNLTIFILFPCIITVVRAEVSCLLPGRCVMMENWSFAWHIQLPSFGCSLFCLMPTGDILADGAACIFIAAKRL